MLPNLSSARIMVVGDIMLDRYWFGDVERISPEAPVPVVKIGRAEERLGGAANVARNISSLGGQVALLSVIGKDEAGKSLQKLLKENRIRAKLQADKGISTTIKLRVIGRQQQLVRIDFETKPSHEVLQNKLTDFDELLSEYDVVILSDYGKGGLTHIKKMISHAREAGKTILIDPKGEDYKRYRGATILTPNRSELKQVVGSWKNESDLTRKAQGLRRKLNLEALLLTRSEEGMTLFREGEVLHVPAQAREVFDVSGAGDTVIATLGVMLGCGMEMAQAVKIANQAAGIVVGKLGTAVVHYEELFGGGIGNRG